MALDGLAAEVEIEQVHALLLARTPAILDEESEDHALYESSVKGTTAEVVAVAGENPDGAYRDLAVWAITVGVAAQLESALFPEQQLGDGSRAATLQKRYEGLLARLGAATQAVGTVPSIARPRGSFPDARPYPDAVERC